LPPPSRILAGFIPIGPETHGDARTHPGSGPRRRDRGTIPTAAAPAAALRPPRAVDAGRTRPFQETHMNIFSRMANLVRGFFSLFVTGLEQQHPEIAYENAINTMIEKYNKLKNASAGLIRLREDAADRLQKAQRQQAELSAMLEQAMATEQDDLAVELIERKDAVDADIVALQAELEGAGRDVETAKTALTEVKNEIAKLKAEKDRMLAKMQSAQARTRINDQLEGLSVDAELRALENVRTGIKDTIARAKLGDELRESDLDTRLNALKASSGKATARAKLEALKKERAAQGAGDRTI